MNKSIPLSEIPSLVKPGATVALGGAWLSNHPMAAVRQLIRDGVDDLRLISSLASMDADLLIGAGAVREIVFSMVSLEAYGLAPNFRRAVEEGSIAVRELSGVALNVAFDAGAHRLPFLPMRDIGGSDLAPNDTDFYHPIRCPFTGEDLLAVRGIEPDVAIVHATRCDREGNAQVDASLGNDPEIARAGVTTIVTCEELVSGDEITRDPSLTHIPGLVVDAVIEAPFGAHPTSHIPRYVTDGWCMLDYVTGLESASGNDAVEDFVAPDEPTYRDRMLAEKRREVLARLAEGSPPLAVSA